MNGDRHVDDESKGCQLFRLELVLLLNTSTVRVLARMFFFFSKAPFQLFA